MKVMFYINTISHGGAERVIVNLAEGFSKSGYETVLVTSFVCEKEYAVSTGVQRLVLEENNSSEGWLKKNLYRVKRLRKLCKQERPDVLISFMAEPNFRALLACLGLKTKNLISVRNDPNKEYPNLVFRCLAKCLYYLADGVVFQTEDAQQWFPKAIQKKSKVIFNQVADNFYNTEYIGERHDIVATGRLVSQKNHRLLINAFAIIADKTEENLYIYGEGNLRDELQALIDSLGMENRIFLPGVIEDVAETIKSAKIYVLSSDYEGMPNALMEALALGIPCVATDCPCGGPRMLIENRKDGLLVPVGVEKELGEALLKILEDNAYAKQISVAAKHKALIYKPEKILEKWSNYVKEIIRGACG